MEFGEKLQELRKEKGLTQEALAEALFVSRTAISKWESGRGYPSLDSLQDISRYFSVSIDALLSSERLITLAERENEANLRAMCNLWIGLIDLFAVALIVLPLYPQQVDSYIAAVSLPACTHLPVWSMVLHWGLIALLVAEGIAKVILFCRKVARGQEALTLASLSVSALSVFFYAMTREPYALSLVFLLFLAKLTVLFAQLWHNNVRTR